MSEREDEVARGVARALQERDDKEHAKNAEASVFALIWFVALAALTFLFVWLGFSLAHTMIAAGIGSLVIGGMAARWVSKRARERGAPGY